jgi:hypothetical protein
VGELLTAYEKVLASWSQFHAMAAKITMSEIPLNTRDFHLHGYLLKG